MQKKRKLLQGTMLWGEHHLPEGQAVHFKIGPLNLWCEKAVDEIWVAYEYSDTGDKPVKTNLEPPENIAWSRWVFKGRDAKIRLVPAFPDRSVVVKPEYSFRIVQGAKARIYIRVPIWIRIEQAGAKEVQLVEIPSVIQSRTWFGTVTDGELCYWVTTSARRRVVIDPSMPYLAICPVQIINSSDTDLEVEKLALRVRRLSIFQLEKQLWSDEMKVEYRGARDVSKITISGKVPKEAKGAKLITSPRKEDTESLTRKTFSTLKDLTGLDLFIK